MTEDLDLDLEFDVDRNVELDLMSGTVVCEPSKGNCQMKLGRKLKWKKKQRPSAVFQFRLRFSAVPVAGLTPPTTPWPFGVDPAPKYGTDNSTDWVDDFQGTLNVEGVFKYSVDVREPNGATWSIDPMIIVRRI